MKNGSSIVDMEQEVGFCAHELWSYGLIHWDAEFPMPFVVCAICDYMICSLPDYYEFTY